MADEATKEMVLAAEHYSPLVVKRDVSAEINRIRDKFDIKYARILEAVSHFADSDEDLAKLTPRARQVAIWARQSRKEVPFAIQVAHDRDLARMRGDRRSPNVALSLSINGKSPETAVVLPARSPHSLPADVKVVDVGGYEKDPNE